MTSERLMRDSRVNTVLPINAYVHNAICAIASSFFPATVLDMGGTGKTQLYLNSAVTSVNIKGGIDCRNLPYEDNYFDLSLSVAAMEHIGGFEGQKKFIDEAVRVATMGSVHWFPFGEAAEDVEKVKVFSGLKHPCIVPKHNFLDYVQDKYSVLMAAPRVTCREHLTMLCSTFPKKVDPRIYSMIDEFSPTEPYGMVLTIGEL